MLRALFFLTQFEDEPRGLRDRVDTGIGHRAVRHLAFEGGQDSHCALLVKTDLVLLRLADERGVETARVPARNERLDPSHHAFFVDHRGDPHAARQVGSRAPHGLERRDGGREPAFHVGRAAPVDAARVDDGVERRVRPGAPVALSDDVGVAFKNHTTTGLAGVPVCDHVGPAGGGLVHRDPQAAFAKIVREKFGGGRLGAGRVTRPVDAWDAHEGARQPHELVGVDRGGGAPCQGVQGYAIEARGHGR